MTNNITQSFLSKGCEKKSKPKKTPEILMSVTWLQKLARRANVKHNSKGTQAKHLQDKWPTP
jgi:hypothetical protein